MLQRKPMEAFMDRTLFTRLLASVAGSLIVSVLLIGATTSVIA